MLNMEETQKDRGNAGNDMEELRRWRRKETNERTREMLKRCTENKRMTGCGFVVYQPAHRRRGIEEMTIMPIVRSITTKFIPAHCSPFFFSKKRYKVSGYLYPSVLTLPSMSNYAAVGVAVK